MQLTKVFGYISRLFLVLAMGLALFTTAPPAAVKADPNPVDLELGGTGATSWYLANIKPADTGTQTVELRNIGTKDGFVTIWVSDIISTEGLNPESETGNTSEPGEHADNLLLNLSASGLITNLNLPSTINGLPQSATHYDYIEVTPIKAGNTVNLTWQWLLPAETGNDVQGDSIFFSINYLLRECIVTDVSSIVNPSGNFTQDVTTQTVNNKGTISISSGVTGKTTENQSLSDIWLIEIDKDSLPPGSGKKSVSLNYEVGPDGATFDQPVTITLSYNPGSIPSGVSEQQLYIAHWDNSTGQWVPVAGSSVNASANTVSAPISHFSRYTVISPVPSGPGNGGGSGGGGGGGGSRREKKEEETPPTTGALLEINILDRESTVEIGDDGTLAEALTLTGPDGNIILDIDAGTRITGPDDVKLIRIELRPTDKPILAPDNIVLLSQAYELIGYTSNMEAVPVVLRPPVRLTIKYDPRNLPENSFLPFVATYTDEAGFVRLNPPPGALIEIGYAKALISDESLFVAAAELAPPPPPLPASFEATNLIINPLETYVGEVITVSVTIANQGETEGSTELYLIIDGIVRAIEEVTLKEQSTETLTFEVTNLAAGSHQVKIAGLTGEFDVLRLAVSVEETKFNWLLLDTIVGSLLLVGATVLYFHIRRSRRTRLAMLDEEPGDRLG